MMSVTIAMSIDYSLFLLSRYREEVERQGYGVMSRAEMISISQNAVRQSARWSGKVIALSGTILSLTYFGLCFYPMEVLQSVGLGAGLAIVCTILVNLTLTPALLLLFPYFFSQFGWAGCPCQYLCCTKGNAQSHDDDDHDGNAECCSSWRRSAAPLMVNDEYVANNGVNGHDLDRVTNPSSINGRVSNRFGMGQGDDLWAAVNENDCCEKCWFQCGSRTTALPWSLLIIVIVYAAIAPVGWQFTTFEQQLADTLIFPRDSPYYATYNDVVADFNAGFIAPWYILIFKKDDQPLINSTSYSEYMNETGLLMKEVFDAVENATKYEDKGYNVTFEGIGFVGSNDIGLPRSGAISLDNWERWISCSAYNCSNEINKIHCAKCMQINQSYQYLLRGKVSDDGTSTFYQMTTEFDPFYKGAIDFVSDFRGWLSAACSRYGYQCYLAGGSVDEVDSVTTIYAHFPVVLCGIVAFVFCLMGLVFKSVFVPFRLFITIMVPMLFVYGLAVMVYQHGLLSGLNAEAFANTDGLYWLIPVMTVTILIGLALDYDVFLFARIYEYRVMGGVSTEEAIIRGVFKTGSIITAAGIIMGIAFCGLLLSQITSLNQTGFIMVVAVLVDTFIIRTSLVPAVLSIAKEVNWWPGLNVCRCRPRKSGHGHRDRLVVDVNSRSSNVSEKSHTPMRL